MNLLLIIGPIVLTLVVVVGTFLALKGQLGALGGLFGAMGALGNEQQAQQRILQTGVPARARVLHVQHTGQSVSFGAHRHLRLTLRLELHRQGAGAYTVQRTQLLSELLVPAIQPGGWLEVRVDRNSPQQVAVAGAAAPPQPAGGYGPPPAAAGHTGPAGGAYASSPAPAAAGHFGASYASSPAQAGYTPPAIPPVPQMPNISAQLDKSMKRTLIMTVGISVLVAIPLLAVFVDWSAWMSGSDAPDGGYCKALVRCCKTVHGSKGHCDNYANLPGSGCKSAFESYQRTAEARRESCK